MHGAAVTRGELQAAVGVSRGARTGRLSHAARRRAVSLRSGLPDPELFPIDDLVRLSEKVLREEFAEALQYGGAHDDGIAAGYIGLRDVLAERTRGATGRAVDRHGVMVTCGAAQALALMFEAFVDPGDAVAIEAPTWNSVLADVCAPWRRDDRVAHRR